LHTNRYLQQVKIFKYLGCEIAYQNEKDIQIKLTKLLKYWETNFGPETFKKKVYNALALSILLHGSEIWMLIKDNKKLLT
jgi:hypothetical protein